MSQEYTQYISEHKSYVTAAYMWLVEHNLVDPEFLSETSTTIALHDASKYSTEEYKAYDNYFYGKKTKEVEEAFDYAWLHHIHENPHHWQHWVLFNDDNGTYGLEMPKNYVYEMIADWWSFSHKKGDLKEIFSWYAKHKDRMILHANTRKLVEDILDKIKKILEEEK